MIYYIDKAALVTWVCGRFCSLFPSLLQGRSYPPTQLSSVSLEGIIPPKAGGKSKTEITMGRESFEVGMEGLPRIDVGEPEI